MSNRMWGGRFAEGPDAIMEEINASIDYDRKLYRQDIDGSKAHVRMLAEKEIVTTDDADKIVQGLDTILSEIEKGEFKFSRALEDIHMNVEARLAELIGPAAGRLHTARSRNDQVATDFRLWVRDTLDTLDQQLGEIMQALAEKAEAFPSDRNMTAEALGFDRPTANSLDAVSDRDFVIEALSAASLTAMHLSRLAEEIVVWCSAQFGFVKLSDKFSTGSSIMPQKKNPDAAELVRAKTGRIYGSLQALLVMMKGLPLAYSKDMQEDKEQAFDGLASVSLALAAMTGMVRDLEPVTKAMKKAAGSGYSTATDLADWLVRVLGMPFRDAHHVTGRIVGLAADRGIELHKVPLEDMRQVDPKITEEVFSVLSVDKSVRSRTSYGGTSPVNVRKQARRWLKDLSKD